jgi:hypothetical protein
MRRLSPSSLLILLVSALPALAVESGNYRGSAAYGGELAVSVEKQRFKIEVTRPGCQGDTEGALRPAGKDRWRVVPDESYSSLQCVIGIRRKGNGFAITEKDCLDYHGASCSFDGSVTAGKAVKSASADGKDSASGSADDPVWTYGVHPQLGKSAYVETSDGAVGLACAYFGNSAAMAHILSFRATPNLAKQGTLDIMFDDGSGGGVPVTHSQGFVEYKSDTCTIHLDSLKKASVLHVLEGRVEGFDNSSGETVMTVSQDGATFQFSSKNIGELDKLKARRFPLTGSAKAINRMIAECPAAQRDIEWMCGAD